MANPIEILAIALSQAHLSIDAPRITNHEVEECIDLICRDIRNRACVRFILACCLAKTHRPEIDIRKPYTEIQDNDAYSGRTYDEQYLTTFIIANKLPCNTTTAFLTPAFRNRNAVLTPDIIMVGRPESLYHAALQLLTDIQSGKVLAGDVLVEAIRLLVVIRDEQQARMESLIAGLKTEDTSLALSGEAIVLLIEQHLKVRGSSRLPVLIIAAVYEIVGKYLLEHALPLQGHNAADKQTGSLGDLEITLMNEDQVITCYEMKMRRVIQNDIDQALLKIEQSGKQIDNYIFITTDHIDDSVKEYAAALYERTGGIEIVVLDCVSFLRYFLHLFHRLRGEFLNAYQELVLAESDSAVSQASKEAFLALRHAAESSTDAD